MRRNDPSDTVMALHYDQSAVAADLARWCDGQVEHQPGSPDIIWVPSAHGPRAALVGDWIVRQTPHEFRPYTAEDFRARFSALGEATLGDPQSAAPGLSGA